ncbi:MAG: oligosaccharide flippase family protein [Oscillospiraceae bacterium]|nr:oligosaccharide flippase family protein [Oscillospiraceae bacterium]
MKRNILKDTILLTVIQMTLDGLALVLNVFLTRRLGTEAIGILTLTASFFRLAALTSNGNAFLCVSRFISEELGKTERDPGGVMRLCIGVSMALSAVFTTVLLCCAPWCSVHFLKSPALAAPIRLMALSLPLVALTSCVRGWFNACCKSGLCAASDTVDFGVRSAVMVVAAAHPQTTESLCRLTAVSMIAGAAAQLLFLLCFLPSCHADKTGRASLDLGRYLRLALPVMGGSALTSFLGSANDALVPITLRQAGNSTAEAFSQFGIFEAIILPTLFFPSTVLCSLAGILITETAREKAAGRSARITRLTETAVRKTIVFAVFVTAILMLVGRQLGELLGGGDVAGKMIVLLAPVVPFIYLEIVLESIIKGIGEQVFSSVNYLCEYIIRISFVLLFIPVFGFYGIVISYYASNVCGNLSRIVCIIRKTGMPPDPVRLVGIPVFSAVFATQLARMVLSLCHLEPGGSIPSMCLFTAMDAALYLLVQRGLFRLCGTIPASGGIPVLGNIHKSKA